MMKSALLWSLLLLAIAAAPAWAQSQGLRGGAPPRLQSADPKGSSVQSIPGVTPRSQSADPTVTQQGIKGQTPRFDSAKPGATTQSLTPRR
jgi:hypothetical protein